MSGPLTMSFLQYCRFIAAAAHRYENGRVERIGRMSKRMMEIGFNETVNTT